MSGQSSESSRMATTVDNHDVVDNHHDHDHAERMISSYQRNLERRLVRKLDYILLPFLSLLFLLNSLDRSNIGNAETAHFTRDAGLEPGDLNVAVACFFAFFVALQPVGAAAGRKFGMGRWVPSVMALWGLGTVLHAWITQKWQLISLRILIGILEAGFYPTTVSYLSLFYTRYEFARRLALFYGQYAVAGAIGGVLAFVVFSSLPSSNDADIPNSLSEAWRPWQILFLFEGALTIIVAVTGFFWLPRNAGTAWFLNRKEREWAENRIRIDRAGPDHDGLEETFDSRPSTANSTAPEAVSSWSDDEQTRRLLSRRDPINEEQLESENNLTSDSGLSKPDVLSAVLFLPLAIPILLLNIASAIPSTAFSIFLPLVLESMNLSSPLCSNLLTAPPFIIAAVTLYAFTYWSDRSQKRIIPVIAGLGLIAIGLVLTLALPYSSSSSPRMAIAQYVSLCILLSGSFVPSPLTVAWLSGNIPQPGKRAIILGINGWGNLAGVLAAVIFAPRWRGNGYRVPLAITLGFVVISFLGFAILRIVIMWLNTARSRALVRWSETEVEREPGDDLDRNRQQECLMGDVPAFAVVGGKWWDEKVRYWVGQRLLGMDRTSSLLKRGDEQLTFKYGL